MKDYSGFDQQNIYDADGNLSRTVSNQGEMMIDRDLMNRPQSIRTSWGVNMENSYSQDGDLQSVTMSGKEGSASMMFDKGSLKSYTDYNGSKTDYLYYTEGENSGLLNEVKKDCFFINYTYDVDGGLSEVELNDLYKWTYEDGENSNKLILKRIDGN